MIFEGDKYAQGLLPGADTVRIRSIWKVQRDGLGHEETLIEYIKFHYMTTDGFAGQDTLEAREFIKEYPVKIED